MHPPTWHAGRAPRSPIPRLAIATAAALALSGCGSDDGPATPALPLQVSDAAGRCAALAGSTLPASAIGLPTRGATITEARLQPADAATGQPEHCRVLGDILAAEAADPAIKFQLNLPSRWNAKTLQFGGGGFNGTVVSGLGGVTHAAPTAPTPLARGYATFGGDSGHQSLGGTFGTNAQALANYAGESVKRTRDAALALQQAYYGAAPQRVYYQGGSKGGHEGLVAAQRYGTDFDGVIAYYPANQNQAMVLSWYRLWQAAYRAPGGYLTPAKQQLVKTKVLEACDALDGLADGLVSNIRACDRTFSVAPLRCAGGADAGDACLSDAQIDTLRAAATPMQFAFPLAHEVTSIGPYPVFQGGDLSPWLDATGTGNTAYRGFADGVIRFFIVQEASATSENFDYRAWQPRVQEISRLYDATDPDVDAFRAKGAKLLMVQGTTDMLVTHTTTSAYYERLAARYGSALAGFARYYVVPGFAHGAGDFVATWDALSALEAWVERGEAPAHPVTVDAAPATAGRSRPLCEYPAYPRYGGSGDPNSAASFACTNS